ncbi:MAG: serine/threonine-protein kinase [Myxococcota bacterium]
MRLLGESQTVRVGRYRVLEQLGAGAAGTVYRAHDPELHRDVAVKVLTPKGRVLRTPDSVQARLAREAQAIAALSHPNIVAIYDVGTTDAGLFIAMELVAGKSLRAWMAWMQAQAGLDWRTVIETFCHAGRGLAAAHERGLVHRDFKPDNVMVGDDGTVKVLDFGLARATQGSSSSGSSAEPAVEDSLSSGHDALGSPLTQSGRVVGTPAYMAPEQHAGQHVGPAADQFAFCVALYEALYGARPFVGQRVPELARAKQHKQLVGRPVDDPVPERVYRAVVRGLSPNVDARWPTMRALVAALERRSHRSSRWPAVALAGGVLGLAGVAVVATRPDGACQAGAATPTTVFGPARRAAIHSTFARIDAIAADATFGRVEAVVDAYLADWSDQHRRVCEDGGAELDARMQCLNRGLGRVKAVLDVLDGADAGVMRNAVQATTRAAGRRPACDDVLEARGSTQETPGHDAAWDLLARAAALENAGKYGPAARAAAEALARAETLQSDHLVAAALHRSASVAVERGEPHIAEKSLERAFFVAVESDAQALALDIAVSMTLVYADGLDEVDHARTWLRRAESEWQRGGVDGEREAALLRARASVLELEGDYEGSLAAMRRTLEIRIATLGPDDFDTAVAHFNLASYLATAGRFGDAAVHMQRAVDIWEHKLGPTHPDLALSYDGLGTVLGQLGNYEQAARYHRRSLEITEASLGPESLIVASTLVNLGIAEGYQGDIERSEGHIARARRIYEAEHGSDHPDVARARINMGLTYAAAGRHEDALAEHRAARLIAEGSLGADHLLALLSCINIADELRKLGRGEEALATVEPCVTTLDGIEGATHYAAVAKTTLGQAYAAVGRLDDATEALEVSLAAQLLDPVNPEVIAQTRFHLALALTAQGVEPQRARALAEQARDAYKKRPATATEQREVEAWLAATAE